MCSGSNCFSFNETANIVIDNGFTMGDIFLAFTFFNKGLKLGYLFLGYLFVIFCE